jgi:hypothetical protein
LLSKFGKIRNRAHKCFFELDAAGNFHVSDFRTVPVEVAIAFVRFIRQFWRFIRQAFAINSSVGRNSAFCSNNVYSLNSCPPRDEISAAKATLRPGVPTIEN